MNNDPVLIRNRKSAKSVIKKSRLNWTNRIILHTSRNNEVPNSSTDIKYYIILNLNRFNQKIQIYRKKIHRNQKSVNGSSKRYVMPSIDITKSEENKLASSAQKKRELPRGTTWTKSFRNETFHCNTFFLFLALQCIATLHEFQLLETH